MRKLNVKDTFKAAVIIRKAKMRNEVMEIATKSSGESLEQLGLNVLLLIAEKAPDVENELYELLGDVSGLGAENIPSMELGAFKDLLVEIAAENDLKSFFVQAAGSLT